MMPSSDIVTCQSTLPIHVSMVLRKLFRENCFAKDVYSSKVARSEVRSSSGRM